MNNDFMRHLQRLEYFSEMEKFHGFRHINTSCVTSRGAKQGGGVGGGGGGGGGCQPP